MLRLRDSSKPEYARATVTCSHVAEEILLRI
jgi:hypothetical protein